MAPKPKKTISIDAAISNVKAAASRQFAAAFVDGVDNASEENHPLSQLQQQNMLTMQFMAYHDLITEVTDTLDMEWQLSQHKRTT